MARPARRLHQDFTTREDQPLIGIPRDDASIRRALSLAGAWQELDSEDGPDPIDELDRMRHESKPSPPLKL